MKKNVFTKAILLCLVVLFMVSCSKQDNLKCIPKNAEVVVSIDAKSLIKKGELNKLDQYEFSKEFSTGLSGKQKVIFDKIKEDPSSLGIDFSDEVYFFSYPLSTGTKTPVVAISLSDKGDFEKTLTESDATIKIIDGKNYRTVENNKGAAWNDKVLLLFPETYRLDETIIAQLFENKETITDNKDFSKFLDEEGDIKAWISGDLFANLSNPMTGADPNMAKQLKLYKGSYMHFTLQFDDKEIVSDFKWNMSDSLKDFMKKYPMMKKDFDKDLLQFLPKTTMGLYAANVDLPVAYNYYNSQLNTQLTQIDQLVKQKMGLDLKTISNEFEGNIIGALTGFHTETKYGMPRPTPDFVVLAKTKSDAFYTAIPKALDSTGIQIQNKGTYYELLNVSDSSRFYISNKNKMLMMSNSLEQLNTFLKGGFAKEGLQDTDVAKLAKNATFGYLNLDYKIYQPLLQNSVGSNPKAQKMAEITFNVLDHFEIVSENQTEGKARLVLKNTEKNSLYTLLKMIDKNYVASK